MRIFNKKQKENQGELALWQIEPERSFDMFAALSKALLLFLLVYGAMGGFLSAYEVAYNKGICMLAIFLFSCLMASVYEMGKKWLINLTNIAVLLFYFYIAIANYWAINSGYYSLINTIYEDARDFLGLYSGAEYTLMYEEEYMAVTLFALFIGMVGCILLNIELQNKANLLKVVLLTSLPYLIPIYFKKTPELIYLMFLFSGYVTVGIVGSSKVKKGISKQIRYVLPVAVICVVLFIRLTAFLLPVDTYQLMVGDNPAKVATEDKVSVYAQYGMQAMFRGSKAGSGVSGGMLTNAGAVMPEYKTDLIVRFTPYSYQSVYLKAFTGKDYDGTRWSATSDALPEDSKMLQTLHARIDAYQRNDSIQGKGIMEVENVDAASRYQYIPYYTDYALTKTEDKVTRYTYYPSGGPVVMAGQEVDDDFLKVPSDCYDAVQQICEEAEFAGDSEEIANQIIQYFDENYHYTMRPGYNFKRTDYITHFLLESKRGYCAHFASSATMLFRYMGIPARYAEGYAISYYDIVDAGDLVEGAKYEDYYSGFAPLGETALIELEVPDSRAHAWVEIYIEGRGWIVVDPTPASNEEETTSFWDAFRISDGRDNPLEIRESNLGAYMETAISGTTYLLMGIATMLVVLWAVRTLIRMKRESELPERERTRLAYHNLIQAAAKKQADFATCKTITEQVAFLNNNYNLEISEETEAQLYQVFFAKDTTCDLISLRKNLNRLRKKLKMLCKARR